MQCIKLFKNTKRIEADRDFQKILTSEFMAIFAQAHGKKDCTRDDIVKMLPFFRLSGEKEDVNPNESLTPTEKFKKAKEQLGGKIKRDGNK